MTTANLIIGIEHYGEGLVDAPHTVSDAQQLARVWGNESLVLLDTQATRTAILSRLRKLAKTPPEHLRVWFGGLAFHEDGEEYLACSDTLPDDRAETALPLRELIAAIRQVKAQQTVLLLDPRGGVGQPFDPQVLSDTPLNVFVAHASGEKSHVSGGLKAGLFAHLVAEAFAGRAPLALEAGGALTTDSLLTHLQRELPRLLRATFREAPSQTPLYYGRPLHLADVAEALPKEASVADPRLLPLKRGVLRGETRLRVRSLGGFRKFHRLPDRINEGSRRFVADLAAPDIQADVDQFYASIRELLGYKRRDVEGSADRGSGFVRTPDFEYSVSVDLAEDDPTVAVIRREVGGIQNPEVVLSGPFQQVFGDQFDTLVFEFLRPFDLEAWVDRIEEQMPEGVKLRCAPDASRVEITLPGVMGLVRLLRDRVEVQAAGPRGPTSRGLVDAFLAFQDRFHGRSDLQELPLLPGE
ncbi:MAG: hypothetical protein SNJ82_11105 [Gemmataceae bacterium]